MATGFQPLILWILLDSKWRNPDLREVIDYLNHQNDAIKANAAAYLQHLCYMDDNIKAQARSVVSFASWSEASLFIYFNPRAAKGVEFTPSIFTNFLETSSAFRYLFGVIYTYAFCYSD